MKKWFMIGFVIAGSIAGMACKDGVTPPPPTAPTIVSFTATPATIHRGESSTLAWNVTAATSITIDNGVGAVTGTSKLVSPTQTTTYTLTATNTTGSRTATCTVTVQLVPPVVTSFTATPASIMEGGTSTLAWTVTGATTITIDQAIGSVAATGTTDVTPGATTTYTLTATNADGNTTATAQVAILPRAVLTLTTNPASPVWTYDVGTNTTTSTFQTVFTESNNVGGTIDDLHVGTYLADDTRLSSQTFPGGTFLANGTLSVSCPVVSVGRPVLCVVLAEGTDSNGYTISEILYSVITWPTNMTAVQFYRFTPDVRDPRVLRAVEQLGGMRK